MSNWSSGSTTFDFHWKSYGELGREEFFLSFVTATMGLLLFQINKRGLYCAGSMVLTKHVTHYGP